MSVFHSSLHVTKASTALASLLRIGFRAIAAGQLVLGFCLDDLAWR